jgi:hypothetical protein
MGDNHGRKQAAIDVTEATSSLVAIVPALRPDPKAPSRQAWLATWQGKAWRKGQDHELE